MTGLSKQVRDEILDAISQIGRGATITDIEQRTRFERHTLSKYLFLMKMGGWLEYRMVGKAKIWHINAAPVQAILNVQPETVSFSQKLLQELMQALPFGLFIIDDAYVIHFMNAKAIEAYGEMTGQHLYQSLLDQKNPLYLAELREVVEGKRDKAELQIADKHKHLLRLKVTRLQEASIMHLTLVITEGISTQEISSWNAPNAGMKQRMLNS